MRKLKLQMQQTIDGFVGGLNGELDWMEWNWDNEIKKYVLEITSSVDLIIMGRKLAEGFIPYWANEAVRPDDAASSKGKAAGEDKSFAIIMNEMPKVVFSKTLKENPWERAKLNKGELKEEVMQMKKQEGKDFIAYGGANFVSNLIKENLIDEYHLFINQAAIGNGLTIFKDRNNLKLIRSAAFPCGIVALHYESLNK